ncbi:hypothetical protein E1292_47910 [Nonomuraea deserti]|uniref:Uncharacterized protein n=1 Tax=Nonomuraea deserti TaxID=1848322 RepID=A0A4R4U540_9ACTN|nr:hypothetical protein [Nonomuraea deserti]TDC86447.1 hypothetical protein E1292_47910 [Nonomuraea deserti]
MAASSRRRSEIASADHGCASNAAASSRGIGPPWARSVRTDTGLSVSWQAGSTATRYRLAATCCSMAQAERSVRWSRANAAPGPLVRQAAVPSGDRAGAAHRDRMMGRLP